MDELRSEIWDYLGKRGEPTSVEEIARHFERDQATIWAAVDHEWFQLSGDTVGIAYMTEATKNPEPRREP